MVPGTDLILVVVVKTKKSVEPVFVVAAYKGGLK